MAVNGLLEGFLTVYGWTLYGTLFLLIVATGAVIYPLARLVFDAFGQAVERGGAPDQQAQALLLRLVVYGVVLVLGVLPFVPLTINSTTVHHRCAQASLAEAYDEAPSLHHSRYGFGDVESARVPLLPYLAMVLASGFNAVLYQAMPCVHDLTQLNVAMNVIDYRQAEDPNALIAATHQFMRECHQPAQALYQAFIGGRFGAEGVTLMKALMAEQADSDDERRRQLLLLGSTFYQEVFYSACTGVVGTAQSASGQLCNQVPLRARNPVEGFSYRVYRDLDASQFQIRQDEGLPTCLEWWTDPQLGLRAQLAAAGEASLKSTLAMLQALQCPGLSPWDVDQCYEVLRGQIVEAEDWIVEQMQLSQQRNLLDDDTRALLGGAGIGLGIAALFGFNDAAAALASNAAGYYTTMFLFKIGASLLQPFLLMTVFMLWGVFLVFGEMRGMMLIKGMMLIFVLSILPSLWSLADHIDDQLFLAMNPGAPVSPFGLSELLGSHSTVERMVLDVVTTAFYVILPLLMLYLIAEAGGPGTAVKWNG